MNADLIIEAVGYLGSALLIVSMTRTSILKLRIIGLVGSAVFLIYSLLIEAYPIAVVNVVIATVHIFFLRQLLSKRKEFFTILEVHPDSRYLGYFLDFHSDEIGKFQPGFRYQPASNQIRAFVLRDLVPAGLFIGRSCDDHSVEVELDFVIPQYRDFRVGRFLYSDRSGVFRDPECDRAWSPAGNRAHNEYLERMGFEPGSGPRGEPAYVKDLRPLQSV
jgi:hypothetical protein